MRRVAWLAGAPAAHGRPWSERRGAAGGYGFEIDLDQVGLSAGQIAADLSNIGSLPKFCDEIEKIAAELFRVLKPDRFCVILMGDTRRGKHFVPLAFNVMQRFLKVGFVLKEDIVKVQHNCAYTRRWEWKAKRDKFYLIMHEHLFVFRKPAPKEDLTRLKFSTAL